MCFACETLGFTWEKASQEYQKQHPEEFRFREDFRVEVRSDSNGSILVTGGRRGSIGSLTGHHGNRIRSGSIGRLQFEAFMESCNCLNSAAVLVLLTLHCPS